MSRDDKHDDRRPNDRLELSSDAMWRYLVVGRVLAREAGGQVRAEAVAEVAAQFHERLDGRRAARRSRATIYRWIAAYERDGAQGLRSTERTRCEGSRVLPADLLAFVRAEKRADVRASVPEMIRRAREKGVIGPDERVHRSTLWRACRRLGIPTRRRRMPRGRDSRRFAFPHRLDMVLCDGKHFRAGTGQSKRVALFFLDDCTRMGLHVVVGTSESRELFLRGLHGLLRRHGRFSAIYTDNGSGFVGTTIADVVRRLGAHIVLGTAGYPEGRGKVERFNLSAQEDLLRHLPGRTDVSGDCASLELRLSHYLREGGVAAGRADGVHQPRHRGPQAALALSPETGTALERGGWGPHAELRRRHRRTTPCRGRPWCRGRSRLRALRGTAGRREQNAPRC